ncbi:MAG: YbaK/EbsC family protein [Deltaproteobacteria bacterium]|jgi:Ala-tRNA(Pro) deacylase|nr:YbaK/EbsC family protein [Deltaproteobacteria bacterium]
MPTKKLKEFLDSNNVKYITMSHSKAYTAQQVAASIHIKGKKLAKTVMITIDGSMAMAVLPASYKVDFDKFRDFIKADQVELAPEQEFKDRFPGCEAGAMPPFGNLYQMDVYVAASLVEDEDILFNSGSHTELIKMAYKDFEDLTKPNIVRFSYKSV